MNLRRRFLLLTLSIVAVPALIALALGLAQWLTDGWTRSIGSYTIARRWVDRAAESPQEEWSRVIASRPSGLELAIVDGANRVLVSSWDELPTGTRIDLPALVTNPDPGEPEIRVQSMEGHDAVYLVAAFTRPRAFESRPEWLPVIVGPLLFLAPFIAISTWILRDLRRSILTLRDAAVRISSGDLDFELDASGDDEFAEVRSSFETMRRTIRDEYARRARFTMGVSHDLKTPLALIKGYAEAIEDGYANDPKTLERYVRIIRDRSDLLQERISHLIEFLKLETGEWVSTLREVAIAPFLDALASTTIADASLAGRSIERRIEVPPGVVVTMDAVLVGRAIENLVQNAMRHTAATEWIRIEAAWNEGAVTIAVANGGAALDPGRLDLLTEPLYRGDAARQSAGFGLGLSIVRSVVESHGWDFYIGAERPGETRFVIRAPGRTVEEQAE